MCTAQFRHHSEQKTSFIVSTFALNSSVNPLQRPPITGQAAFLMSVYRLKSSSNHNNKHKGAACAWHKSDTIQNWTGIVSYTGSSTAA